VRPGEFDQALVELDQRSAASRGGQVLGEGRLADVLLELAGGGGVRLLLEWHSYRSANDRATRHSL